MTSENIDKSADERIGQTIDSRYYIVSKIAHGGMATVYRAIDRRLDREVALKLMHPHLANGPEGATFVSRFRREARAAARLHHQGIVTVYDQGIDNNISYLTMEFVEGTNLRRRLKDIGTFSIGDALKNMEAILRALAAAHRAGLVHRDVKPENVLINKRGQLQLTDFGLARIATEMSTSTTGTVFGTVAYLAPEIIETGQSDARSDIYSVGVMLYELISGKQPYAGTTPIQIAFKHVNEDIPVLSDIYPEVPRSVALLIEVFSARDMTKRPPDAAKALELLTKLGRSLSANDLAAKLPRPPEENREDGQVNMGATIAGEDGGNDVVGALDFPNDDQNIEPAFEENSFAEGSLSLSDEIIAPAEHSIIDPTTQYNGAQDDLPTDLLTLDDIKAVKSTSHGLNSTNIEDASLSLLQANDDKNSTNSIKHRQKRIKKRLVVVISALLVVLLGVLVFWYQIVGPGSQVAVPYGITGITVAAAEQKLDDAGVKYTTEEVFSDVIEAGKVISVYPDSGKYVSKNGDGIKITVSKGIQLIDIPKGIVGLDVNAAIKKIEELGFDVPKISRAFNKDAAKDIVMSIDPAEETASVKRNATITLKVSDGPKPATMPNLQGMSASEAIATVNELGLTYSQNEIYSDDVAKGIVVAQDVSAGATVYEGNNVAITVSKGPETVEVPNVKGKSIDQAKTELAAAELAVNIVGEADLGLIQKQDIPAGTRVKRGATITLTVV